MRYIGYTRTATRDNQAIERQKDAIRAFVERDGGDPDGVTLYNDNGVSGNSAMENREGGSHLFAGIRAGDTLVIASTDRISRHVMDTTRVLARLAESGVKLHVLKDETTYELDYPPLALLVRYLNDREQEVD